ncbi:TauD/TfdA family dioxygenase [Alcaligenaceae bacterium]|nr:TauD/TfdA family dioxygenase [Alcaligenaceae bacterium]
MKIELRPLADLIGAEILNIDLSEALSPGAAKELEGCFNKHSVLLFRDQDITEQNHIDFSRHFGDLEIHVLREYLLPNHPEILVISNIEENGRGIGISDAGQYWHTDLSYKENPSRCSVLYGKEIPDPSGDRTYGDTCFVSTVAAFDDLDEDMKSYLQTLKAEHHYQARYHKMKENNKTRKDLTEEQKKEVPAVVHPVVRTHPFTGRKSLYVNEGFTTGIVGLPEDESTTLLNELYKHSRQEKFMYRHKWRKGDVLMWDNSATQHLAIADYALPQRRLMHRTTVAGSPVF